MPILRSDFSNSFLFGTASSSYQIEGAVNYGGRGLSIWDTFSHTNNKIFDNQNADVACEHYFRFEEDFKLMKELGVDAYRFSISWPRIFPNGTGTINQEGIDFYNRIINLCLKYKIKPYLTLFHWDLPQALEDKGGWLNPEMPNYFAQYAYTIAKTFKGRVENYFTLNEPQIILKLGYVDILHAPGKRKDTNEQFTIWHNMCLAHGLAVIKIREADSSAKVGIASTGKVCYPEQETPLNIELAQTECFATNEDWQFTHHWLLDPIVLGHYPENTFLDKFVSKVTAKDRNIISQEIDFIGINIYNGNEIGVDDKNMAYNTKKNYGYPRNSLKWPVTPEVMDYGLNYLYKRYNTPIFITECGQSCNDRVFLDTKVHDLDRIDFLQRYLISLKKSIDKGSDVRGFFHWSFTDNFEWHSGFDDRFGLVYIDYTTQKRIPKDSYYWYKDFLNMNIVFCNIKV